SGCVRKADSLRSRNAAEAIHRVDFLPRVLVVRSSAGVSCRVMDVAANQPIVDTGAKEQEQRSRSRPRRPQLETTTRIGAGIVCLL
ncbi:MAG: hypothetical protein ABW292_21835, partial [Vicinamibacterales bacterium]